MRKLEKAPNIALEFPENYLELIGNGEIKNVLNKIHEEYLYWDKVKHLPLPEGFTNRDIWVSAKINRLNTPFRISIGKHEFYWNLNSKLQGLLHFLDMNIGGILESSHIISKGDKNRYLISSIMEEAIASSQIEGAVTTRRQAKDMLRKSIKPKNKSEQMIVNNFFTIKKILEIKSEPLTKENFLSVHKLVASDTLPSRKDEGAIRTDDDINVVDAADGTIVHKPPSTSELDELLEDLFKFFNEDTPDLFIHPIVKACIIHFLVGYIHPFVDGNGRTARALFYWYLLKKEYWLTEYLSISRLILRAKAQYARAFIYTEADDLDLTYFILFNTRTMKLAFDELRLYIQRKNEQKKHLSEFLGLDGINYRQAAILDWFNEDPGLLITVKEVEKRMGISNNSARNDLDELSAKEFLNLVKMDKKSKGFIKGAKFDELLAAAKKYAKQKTANIQNAKNDESQPKLF